MRTNILRTAFMIAAIAAAGCGELAVDEDNLPEVDDVDGKADHLRISGYYKPGLDNATGLTRVRLNEDYSFEWTVRILCVRAPCNPLQAQGTYKLTRSGSNRYIKFVNKDGVELTRYAYRFTADSLSLRQVGSNVWSTFNRACEEDSDCGSGEICARPLCFFYCPAGTPDCCGPAQCVKN